METRDLATTALRVLSLWTRAGNKFESDDAQLLRAHSPLDEIELSVDELSCRIISRECSRVIRKLQIDQKRIACRAMLIFRELEVVRVIAAGYSTNSNAKQLGISVKPAATHRSHILKSLRLHNVIQVTRYAIQQGIVEVEP